MLSLCLWATKLIWRTNGNSISKVDSNTFLIHIFFMRFRLVLKLDTQYSSVKFKKALSREASDDTMIMVIVLVRHSLSCK